MTYLSYDQKHNSSLLKNADKNPTAGWVSTLTADRFPVLLFTQTKIEIKIVFLTHRNEIKTLMDSLKTQLSNDIKII